MNAFKSTFYNTFYSLGHPALGGIAWFTLLGVAGGFEPKVMAGAFVLYSLMWVLGIHMLEYMGWKPRN